MPYKTYAYSIDDCKSQSLTHCQASGFIYKARSTRGAPLVTYWLRLSKHVTKCNNSRALRDLTMEHYVQPFDKFIPRTPSIQGPCHGHYREVISNARTWASGRCQKDNNNSQQDQQVGQLSNYCLKAMNSIPAIPPIPPANSVDSVKYPIGSLIEIMGFSPVRALNFEQLL